MLTKAVRQYLETLGLAADASESDARQFMLTLEGSQLDMCQTLMGARAQDDEDDDEDRRDEDEQLDDEEDDDEEDDDEEDDDEDEDDEDRPSARSRRNRRRRNQDEDEDDEDKKQHALRRAYKHVADVTGIAQTFGLPKRWATRMLNNLSSGRMNMTQVRAAALKQLARRNQPLKTNTPPFGSRIQVGADRNLDTLGTAIHDAIMMRLGADIPEMDDFGQVVVQTEQQTRSGLQRAVKTRQPHARARQFRGQPLHAMARSYLQGLGVNTEGMTPVEVSQLVFNTRKLMSLVGMQAITHTTSDFPAILENIATKRLQQAYIEAPRTWPMFCRRAYAPDFKDVSVAQLDVMATLRKVNEGAEIKHVTIADSGQRYRLETFAEIFTLTWQALVNDDLRVFQRLPQMMGNAATRVEEELVYSIINSNQLPDGSPIFHADNGNLITGAPSGAPSVDQLNAAYAAMARQTSLDGQTELDITPAFLVVPVELRGIALELVTTQVKPGTNDPGGVANIWQGELQPIASPRLSRNSTDVWYLFADPNQIATIEVMFLESEPVPVIEEEESFNSLGRKYRVRHSVAAAAVDHRGMLRNDNNA